MDSRYGTGGCVATARDQGPTCFLGDGLREDMTVLLTCFGWSRSGAVHRTRNLEIPGSPFGRPGMTVRGGLYLVIARSESDEAIHASSGEVWIASLRSQ